MFSKRLKGKVERTENLFFFFTKDNLQLPVFLQNLTKR